MEHRAVVLCTKPGGSLRKHYDLMGAAYPYWTGFARGFAIILLLLGVAAALLFPSALSLESKQGLIIISVLMVAMAHLVFWGLHHQREQAGRRTIRNRHGWNTHDDPNAIFLEVVKNSKQWHRKLLVSLALVLSVDLNLILMLTGQSLGLQSELPLALLLFVLPSSLMIFVDYRRTKTIATSTTQLDWVPNVLGWPGVIRYDDI